MSGQARSDAEAHALFDQHIGIAERLARYYVRKTSWRVELNELRAYAFMGLLDAAKRYVQRDADSRFEYYAVVRVRGAIRDGLRSLEWFQRRKARGNPSLQSVRPISGASVERLSDPGPLPDHRLEAAQQRQLLAKAIDHLPARHAEVIRRHFFEGVLLEQLAGEYGLTPPRLSQIKFLAIARLRELLQAAQDAEKEIE